MRRAEALEALCRLLRREGRAPADWMPIVAIANQAALTPALLGPLEALAARGEPVPDDLLAFVEDVEARNTRRNDQLLAALGCAAAALNAAGITPVLIKGGALVLTDSTCRRGRLLTDMDLLVRPAEVEQAIEALTKAGFGVIDRYSGADVHCVAELGRPEDPGLIDLHQRPAGPPAAADLPDLEAHCAVTPVGEGRVLLPPPEILVFFTILHDQLHDGDFWRGGIDLRHLLDFALLCERGIDWRRFDRLCRTGLIRRAAHAQLLAAQRLLGARIDPAISGGFAVRAHYLRTRIQHAWPILAAPLGLLAMAAEAPALGRHRRFDRVGRERVLSANVHDGPREGRVRRMIYIFDAQKTGKV